MARGTDHEPRSDTRDRRIRRERRRALVFGGAVAISVIVVVLAVLWASATLPLRGGPQPALAERVARTGRSAATAETPGCRVPLTSASPLRLWIGGDSLAGSLGPSLGAQAAATGVVQPVYDARVSSGLSTPEFFNWPRHAADEMNRFDPEVVVFIIGANDWELPRADTTTDDGEPVWRARYAQLVEEMLDTLEGGTARAEARPVVWVGAPPMQDPRKDAGVREIDAVARAVVERHPSATYVDAYDLFSGPGGGFAASLRGPDGSTRRMRTADGVHLTPEGGDLLGALAYRPIDARCHLDLQAVTGAPKPVLRAPGSTQVPGTQRAPSSPAPEVTSSTTSTTATTNGTASTASTTATTNGGAGAGTIP